MKIIICLVLAILFISFGIYDLVKIFKLTKKKDKNIKCFVKFDDGYRDFSYDTFLEIRSIQAFLIRYKEHNKTIGYKINWIEEKSL